MVWCVIAFHVKQHERPLLVKNGIGRENSRSIWPATPDFHVNRRVFLHAANLLHVTDGFTSPLKERMLWIFSLEKSDGLGRVRTRDLGYQRTAC
jgi:hypothetical protein